MEPKVSIIVPVYNAQEYLKRCVDSILSQDYRDFELLLMDDGSKDASGEICDAYAQQDSRVRVVHKKNSGVSDTRNQALELARGTFLQFLDSDDWIVPEATRLLVRSMEEYNCDMVISDFYRVSGERLAQKGDIEEDKVMSRQEFASYMIENPADFYYGVLWNKMYRRSIIEEYHIRMDTSISWCEDFLFNLEYIRHAESFFALQVPIYYYLKRRGSLVSQGASITNTVRMKSNIFEYYNEFYKEVYEDKDYADIRLQVYSFLWAAAKDGGVLPGSKKLGEERRRITREEVEGNGAVIGQYRFRRLYEYELDLAAQKNMLTLDEALLLCALAQCSACYSARRLGEIAGVGQPRLFLAMQKLERKKLIAPEKPVKEKSAKEKPADRIESTAEKKERTADKKEKSSEKKEKNRLLLTEEGRKLSGELLRVEKDLYSVCMEGISDEEQKRMEKLMGKIQENMIRFMVKEVPEDEPGLETEEAGERKQ